MYYLLISAGADMGDLDEFLKSEEFLENQRRVREKTNKKLLGFYNSMLERKISEDKEFNRIRMTKNVCRKVRKVADRFRYHVGKELEICMRVLNKRKKKDIAVRDVYIPKQEVTEASYRIVEREFKGKDVVLGNIHYHGDFGAFHSGPDDVQSSRMAFMFDASKKIRIDDYGCVPVERDVKFSYSVVFDSLDRYFGVVNVQYFPFGYSGFWDLVDVNKEVDVELFDEFGGARMSNSFIDEELCNKVSYKGEKIKKREKKPFVRRVREWLGPRLDYSKYLRGKI